MAYRYNREESEHVIRMLADRYPKCFFEDPRQRRPLKNNIAADLRVDGFEVADELLTCALDWYRSHFAYQYQLQAGAKRLGLDGKEVGTVTELEQSCAQKKIAADKQKLAERNRSPVQTLRVMHAARQVPDDQVKKLDAPHPRPVLVKSDAPQAWIDVPVEGGASPIASIPKGPDAMPAPPGLASELTSTYAALAEGNVALTTAGTRLRPAILVAVLGVVIKEAEQVIRSVEGRLQAG